ncbi:MAG: T9SS type A sorting domain-containing protein, partial [Cyclobacteriaceae bacterium]
NATVILESPCYDLSAASSATFSFQNHMYGSNMGSLSLEATTDDQSWSTLWSLSGNQGNQWNEVDVSLDTYAGSTVKLRFVGVTGSSWQSDITIDALELNVDGGGADTEAPSTPAGVASSNITTSSFDVSWNASSDNVGVTGYNIYLDGSNIGTVTGTSASVTGLSASTSYSVRISAIDAASNESAQSAPINVTTNGTSISCSSTVSGFPYSEGFESNDGWTQITGDDGNWLRDANGTPSSGTGPSSAVQGSFYMFLEASTNGSTGQLGSNATAILESPCFDLSSESSATFSFEYHMYGTSVGSLAVQASTDGINWSNIWSLSGNQGNSWQSVNLDLASYLGSEVKLRMVGTTGSSWSSDIAIDDLSLTTGSGGGTTTVTLTIVLDNYPEETSWEILDGTTVVASGGTYGSQPDGSTVVENIDLSSGCYDFVIRDTYGDGICCSYGNGSYSLTDGGTTLASGGSFGSSETTNFCINGGSFNRSYFVSSTSVGVPATFDIYPNPVVGDELKIESTRNDISYSVMNLSGQLVSKGRASGKSIDVSQLGAGLYTIQLESNGKSVVRKFVKQ